MAKELLDIVSLKQRIDRLKARVDALGGYL
jgi:hypothetical protein